MRGQALSEEQRFDLVNRYAGGAVLRQLASDYGVSTNTIRGIAAEAGIPMRRRGKPGLPFWDMCLHDDGIPQRYWGGMWLSDGSLSLPNDCAIKLCDREHVYKWRSYCKSSHAVTEIVKEGAKTLWKWSSHSDLLAEGLIKRGLFPRKSLAVRMPEEYLTCPHTWRGVIDGNGTVEWYRNANGRWYPRLRLSSGVEGFCWDFKAYIESFIGPIRAKPFRDHKDCDTGWRLSLQGKNAISVLRHTYEGYTEGDLVLDRKGRAAAQIIQLNEVSLGYDPQSDEITG